MKSFLNKTLGLVLFTVLLSNLAFASQWHTNDAGHVLDGYDAVAYQTTNAPVKGTTEYAVEYDEGVFLFSSKENMKTFSENPVKYAPKYNGYCAFAMATKGAKVPANADTFKMYNGELLMFFNDLYDGSKFNTIVPWNSGEKTYYNDAEKNWKNLN